MFRLYVDEVGNDDLRHASLEEHRYLSLTGVAVRHDHVRDHATPNLDRIKREIFLRDPDDAIALHRKDIIQKKGPFGCLNDPDICSRFDRLLIEYLTTTEYTVITALIDKKAMLAKTYWSRNHPYHYLMDILIEKYVQLLERFNDIGDIMPEKRYSKTDAALQREYSRVWIMGLDYVDRYRVKARLPAKHLKFRDKKANVTGLQICDLIAHPSHMFIRSQQHHAVTLGAFATRIIPILRDHKYDRSPWNGRIQGYGIKYLP